jgi:GH35 family endo-1,4-beta-xylanase
MYVAKSYVEQNNGSEKNSFIFTRCMDAESVTLATESLKEMFEKRALYYNNCETTIKNTNRSYLRLANC